LYVCGRQFAGEGEFRRCLAVELRSKARSCALQEIDLPGLPFASLLKLLD
jgi:hypothetical protein